ncbi:MAG: 30S ribosome-binding factor RbfA [bacterium]|nr:30S ribosome-binding factor RbfA [bacterium]
MKSTGRMVRVNELIKREIADIIQNKIERISGRLISVTEVDTAPDLRNSKVSISILGDRDTKREAMKKLNNKRSYIQSLIAKNVKLKYTPVLEFELDEKIEAGDKVFAILNELDDEDN